MEKWEQIMHYAPLLRKKIHMYSEKNLAEYLSILHHKETKEFLPSQDVEIAVFEYAQRFLKYQEAKEVCSVIHNVPLLFTANHHGIEYFAQSVQGNLLYERWLSRQTNASHVIPVFAGSTVSIASANYPRGFTLYPIGKPVWHLPILPYRSRQEMVGCAAPFTMDMVMRAREEARKEKCRGHLDKVSYETVGKCLDVYEKKEILERNTYGEQAVLVNRYLTEGLYEKETFFFYIEIEEIVRKVLLIDLTREDSLIYKIFFQESMREKILRRLNGAVGCWSSNHFGTDSDGWGTYFFWGVCKDKRRRYPLWLGADGIMRGKIPGGEERKWYFQADTCIRLLEQGEIIPGIFVDFVELIFTRNFTPLGGCFQGEYLTQIQQGLVEVLSEEKFMEESEIIRQKECGQYLSGPILFARKYQDTYYPLGLCEMLGEDKLSLSKLEHALTQTFFESHQKGTQIFYMDVVPKCEQANEVKIHEKK